MKIRSKARTTVFRPMIGALAVLLLALRAASAQNSTALTPIDDPDAVSFGQLSPILSPGVVQGWGTGAVFVDFQKLAQDGLTGQYLEVVEFDPSQPSSPGTWVIQDLPILDPSLADGASEMFFFGAPPNAPQPAILAAAAAAHQRMVPPAWQQWTPQQQQQWIQQNLNLIRQAFQNALRQAGLGIGGLDVSGVPDLPNSIDPIYGNTNPAPADAKRLIKMNSVAQEINQCAPAAVSNSLQYLIAKSLIPEDGLTNDPDWKKNSRVGALDKATKRAAGLPTPSLDLMNGKLSYIAGNAKIKDSVAVQHMGWFCPGGNLSDPNCEKGDITVAGITSKLMKDPNTNLPWPPTADFITASLTNKNDVEVCFAYQVLANGMAHGGHCVHVIGFHATKDGLLELDILQDAAQGPQGAQHAVGPKTLGHTTLVVGTNSGRLWIKNLPSGPALVTNVISEGPK